MTATPNTQDFVAMVEKRESDLSRHLEVLGRNAKYWGDRHKTGLTMIGYLTFMATLIMAFNLAFKDNIQNVGGWMPFCFAAAALTGLAAYLVNGQKSEDPGSNRMKCLQGAADVRSVLRELQSKKEWNPRKVQAFDRKMKRIESDYSVFLVDPPRFRVETGAWVVFAIIVVTYLTYELEHVLRAG